MKRRESNEIPSERCAHSNFWPSCAACLRCDACAIDSPAAARKGCVEEWIDRVIARKARSADGQLPCHCENRGRVGSGGAGGTVVGGRGAAAERNENAHGATVCGEIGRASCR